MSARSTTAPAFGASMLCLLATIACTDDKVTPPLAPQSRSQGVQATGPAPAAPTSAEQPAGGASAAAEHTVLCAHQLGKAGKEAPKASVSRAGAPGSLPEKLPIGEGHWTWINLWAAWCGPCKEEIPRLKSWEAKTAGEQVPLKVAFISLDDDARQLETFLGAQPPDGLRSTYWLHDGQERLAWLKQAGLDGDPSLPAHLLVDPAGKARCLQQGAIDDGDFAQLLEILRGK